MTTILLGVFAWQNYHFKNKQPVFPMDFTDVRTISTDHAIVEGKDSAPITLVTFSDFNCPPCADMADVLDRVKRRYGNKVKLIYKHTGKLENGLNAYNATLAAANQDLYWPMLQYLYDQQENLETVNYMSLAEIMGLNVDLFLQDFMANQAEALRDQNVAQAKELGVEGTPTVFINGVRLEVNTYDAIREAIEYLYPNS